MCKHMFMLVPSAITGMRTEKNKQKYLSFLKANNNKHKGQLVNGT